MPKYPRKWVWISAPLATPSFASHVIVNTPRERCYRYAPNGRLLNRGAGEENIETDHDFREVFDHHKDQTKDAIMYLKSIVKQQRARIAELEAKLAELS